MIDIEELQRLGLSETQIKRLQSLFSTMTVYDKNGNIILNIKDGKEIK